MRKIIRTKGTTLTQGQKARIKDIFRKVDDFHIGGDALLNLVVTHHEHSVNGDNYAVQARMLADGHHMIMAEATADTPVKAANIAEDYFTSQVRKFVNRRSDHR